MASLDAVKNFAKVTVSTGYDASATSIALTSGHGAKLPAPATDGAFNVVWWNSTDYSDPSDDPNVEIVRVTARSTDTLTVTRAQESTSATTKNTGSKTYKMILGATAKMITDIQAATQTGSMVYAADAQASDTYVITLAPVPAALTIGMLITFKANTANTGAATLNVNSLGATTIKKLHDQDLATGDIEAGQLVTVVYDGTNFQMQSQVAISGSSFSKIVNTTTQAIVSDSGSKTLITGTIPGGKLSTNNFIKIDAVFSRFGLVSAGNLTFTLNYGGNTGTLVLNNNTGQNIGGSGSGHIHITGYITADGATNAQVMSITGVASIVTGDEVGFYTTAQTTQYAASGQKTTTLAVDSTSDQTITLSAALSSINVNSLFTFKQAVIYISS